MDALGGRSGQRSLRRGARRSRRLRWAGALAGFAVAGMMASAQAAQHERSLAEMVAVVGCAASVRFGYEVEYDATIGAHAVVGVVTRSHDEACAGRVVQIAVLGADGEQLGVESVTLEAGAVAWFTDGAPIDAREVAGIRVVDVR